MKSIFTFATLFTSTISFSQDTTIIINRENFPLQAVMQIEGPQTLFVGQDYTVVLTSSGNYDLRVKAENAKIELIENGMKSTGGIRYTLTPIDTGTCSVLMGNQIDDKKSVSLKLQYFRVINYPMPPIHLNGVSSGEIIHHLKDSTKIVCSYPPETGIDEKYPIVKWEASIGDQSFEGNGNLLSEELINYANQVDSEYLHLTIFLEENKTGFSKSEGIYILRMNR